MATMGIRIVHAGNNSLPGHMYVVFKGDDGSVTTFGHFPATMLNGIGGPGGVKINDDRRKHEEAIGAPGTNGVPNVSRDFYLSPADYQKALAYAQNAASQAGDPTKTWGAYDPLYRSCVDFTWNVMREAGLNQSSWFEGYPLPSWNNNPLSNAYFEFFRRPEFNREFKTISPTTNTAYTSALTWAPPQDPLVLDLNGGGISTVGISPVNPILFDHNADGIKTGTGWLGAGEGILTLDINGNSTVDSGRELFGDNTALASGPNIGQLASNGFVALAQHDKDVNGVADGKIDSADAIYSQLRIWQDVNQDGVSQATELQTLAALGVQSINVTGTASNINLGGGNTQTWTGGFTRTNGQTGVVGAADLAGSLTLAANNFYREFTDDPATTAAALALPQMRGSGWVRDLRPAMMCASVLKTRKNIIFSP